MPGTGFDDVLIVNPSRVRPAPADAVARAEAELDVRLPSGYAAYVERLGEGALGHLVRVHAPAELPEATYRWREIFREHWFWDTGDAGLDPAALPQRGVVVANSFDGDGLWFDPADREALFVLPRHDDVVRRVGPGFLAAIDWMVSGALNPWVEGWTFEAYGHRAEASEMLRDRRLPDVARAVADLGEHAHVVELPGHVTYFLPAIGGRLSLGQEEGEATEAHLTYDEDADPESLAVVLAAVRGA